MESRVICFYGESNKSIPEKSSVNTYGYTSIFFRHVLKGCNFVDFLFAFLKNGWKQILSFMRIPHVIREETMKMMLLPLKVYPFTSICMGTIPFCEGSQLGLPVCFRGQCRVSKQGL